ncbi:MAG: hypothetical protein A3J38_05310 [Gammaproteobacteria bacterium RIFCSPHIGHO2_12_FULL_45_9]|nr:MAG: hypothetical protein A3J38_05310 [Gammaproteobacteria bacterium RIFCSPHIGHO2_12_FULL_45_9]
MSAMEPLIRLLDVNVALFSQEEIQLLDALFFSYLCAELKETFRRSYHDYFRLMKFTQEKEDAMLETNFARLLIQDILSTEEYTLTGIAYYTNTHADVIDEVMIGRNTSPSALFFRKIVELHCSVRRDLYRSILKKITVLSLQCETSTYDDAFLRGG